MKQMKILTKAQIILYGLMIMLNTSFSFASYSQHHNQRHSQRGLSTFDVITSNVRLSAGATKTVQLYGSVYIKKLIITAQGASSSDGTMQIVVNGDIKGTVHVPRYDPSYFVTVNASASSIQFVSVSGGAVNISAIKVVGSKQVANNTHHKPWKTGSWYSTGMYGLNAGTLAQEIALEAIDLVDEFTKYSSYQELGDVLLPIKKSATVVYATSYGAGDYSVAMRNSLLNLSQQFNVAGNFINTNFEKTALFDLALQLLTLKERLDFIIK